MFEFSRLFKKQNEILRFKSKENKVQSCTTNHINVNISIIDNRNKRTKVGLEANRTYSKCYY